MGSTAVPKEPPTTLDIGAIEVGAEGAEGAEGEAGVKTVEAVATGEVVAVTGAGGKLTDVPPITAGAANTGFVVAEAIAASLCERPFPVPKGTVVTNGIAAISTVDAFEIEAVGAERGLNPVNTDEGGILNVYIFQSDVLRCSVKLDLTFRVTSYRKWNPFIIVKHTARDI